MRKPRIAVIGSNLDRYDRLFQAVADLYRVTFVATRDVERSSFDAAILPESSVRDAMAVAGAGTPCLAYLAGVKDPCVLRSTAPIDFSFKTPVLPLFAGAALMDETVEIRFQLSKEQGDEIIAQRGMAPLWARRSQGMAEANLVTTELPVLRECDYLYSLFGPHRWFAILPLLHFVKEVAGWTMPSVRACFILDDPNLHWPSYGYVKYRDIAEDAEKHDYHIAFATIPLDGWFVHPSAARVFQEYRSRLSLIVHGNNHTRQELASKLTFAKRVALSAQALRRVERIERASGVEVGRIMAAPHGACNEEMAEALLSTGFDAACISLGSLMARNPGVIWPPCVGLCPAEFLGGGLPVIPRLNIRADPEIRVRLAAFLAQPVIPVGHHDDLSNGLETLHKWAGVINSLENSRWANIQAISETNYWTRRSGDVMLVKMFSRSVTFQVPSGVNRILVDRPWLGQNTPEALILTGSPRVTTCELSGESVIHTTPNTRVTIRSIPNKVVSPSEVSAPSIMPIALVRRHLCEARDRLKPIVDTIARPHHR